MLVELITRNFRKNYLKVYDNSKSELNTIKRPDNDSLDKLQDQQSSLLQE